MTVMKNGSRHEKPLEWYPLPKRRLRGRDVAGMRYRAGAGTVTHDSKKSPGAERLRFKILRLFPSLPGHIKRHENRGAS